LPYHQNQTNISKSRRGKACLPIILGTLQTTGKMETGRFRYNNNFKFGKPKAFLYKKSILGRQSRSPTKKFNLKNAH
jgi:hypothetical protein